MAAGKSVSELASEDGWPQLSVMVPLYFTSIPKRLINFTCASFSNFSKPSLRRTLKLRLVTLPPTGIGGAVLP
jgi:hypothetical protein